MEAISTEFTECPVCAKNIPNKKIELHVDRCLFLHSKESFTNESPTKIEPSSTPDSPCLNSYGSTLEVPNYSGSTSTQTSSSSEDVDKFLKLFYPPNAQTKKTKGLLQLKGSKIRLDTDQAKRRLSQEDNSSESPKKIKQEYAEPSTSSVKNNENGSSFNEAKCSKINDIGSQNILEDFNSYCMPSSQLNNEKSTSQSNGKKYIHNKGRFNFSVPLADMLKPKTIDEFFGQSHVLGENSHLRIMLNNYNVPNMILWGPPGCGKTSLASIIREFSKGFGSKLYFVTLNASDAGVKDVKKVVDSAKVQKNVGKKVVLFMDEIHRFNKKQQDVFLESVEKGEIILIGATTENPSYALNNALLSRCRVIAFQKLRAEDLERILKRAADVTKIKIVDDNEVEIEDNSFECLKIQKSAVTWLAETCDGDARIALSNLQIVLQSNINYKNVITEEHIKEEMKKSHMLYDRKGEEHYNLISAMHKSIRGSDENAAVYWTTRMIVSGEDPRYIARRLVRAASEDIGNEDPMALQLAVSTMQGVQLLGNPEADCLLVQCAIYLARAPKSREAEDAMNRAKRLIQNWKGPQPTVPLHIRNVSDKMIEKLGLNTEANVSESFLPKGLEDVDFFFSDPNS